MCSSALRTLSLTCYTASSTTGSAVGAGAGLSLANGYIAVKISSMKTAGLEEK